MLGKIKQNHVDFTTIAIHVDTTNAIHVDYIYICIKCNDLTATSLEIMVNKGYHPQMAELFRLVKYYDLPNIYIYIYGLLWYKTITILGKIKQKHVDFTTIAIHVDNIIYIMYNIYIYIHQK